MPEEDETKEYLLTSTDDLKLIADYTRLDIETCLNIDCVSYKILFRDAFIHMMSQSEEGREYLEKAWCLTQTTPDRKQLRERFN